MEKKKCFSEDLLCAVLLFGLVFGIVAGLAIYAIAYPMFQSENWAAWVQAIGAIVALCIAIWIPQQERRLQADKDALSELRRRFELLQALAVLANHAARAMQSTTRKITINEKPIRTDRLEDVQLSFRAMLSKEIPPDAISIILEIQCEIAYQISAIKLNNDDHNNLSTKGERAQIRTDKVEAAGESLTQLRDSSRPKGVP